MNSGAMSSKLSGSPIVTQALREGIQCSLREAAADAFCNMGPNIPLDMILKKFTIIYGNVKSFDLSMSNFYRADPPLLIEGSFPKVGTGSQASFPTRRNRGSSRTTCSIGVGRVSVTVSSAVLWMPV